jgi:hypothetical protein
VAAAWHVPAAAGTLQVDLDTGQITLVNGLGLPQAVAAYSIRSSSNRLDASNWRSIAEHYDRDSGGGVDPDNRWSVFGGSANNLSEGTIGAATLVPAQRIDLGIGAWLAGGPQDLQFDYVTAANQVVTGTVEYGAFSRLGGDFNLDLVVDGDDYLVWQIGYGTQNNALHREGDADYDRDVDGDDFLIWQSQWTADADGMSATATAVPEPGALAFPLLGACLGGLRRGPRRRLTFSTGGP